MKVIALVSKTRSKYLLVRLQSDANFPEQKHVDDLLDKIKQEYLKLRNINIFIKVAIYAPFSSIDIVEYTNEKLLSKDLTAIKFFENINKAINWLDIVSSLDDITAFFQPIVSLENSKIVGYEALARKIVDNEIIPINEWMPQLFNEKQGSYRLSEKILVIAENKSKQLEDDQHISVNFEVSEINSNGIKSLLKPYEQSKFLNKLIVEVCERGDILINHNELIDNIKNLDIRIALDDLGTGHARLLQLLDFSPHLVKLDKKITDRMNDQKVASFISYFCTWCDQNNIYILAEGIETEDIAIACQCVGIKYGQGFLFGKPQAELVSVQNESEQEAVS
ncbi:EAL domain-containing protein [Colwelliaceae bacterium BS250]